MLHFVFFLYDIHVQFLLLLAIIYVICICDMIYLLRNCIFLNCMSYVSCAQTDLCPNGPMPNGLAHGKFEYSGIHC